MMIYMIFLVETEGCKRCKLCYDDDLVKFWCAATAKPIPANTVSNNDIPDWCPLKELPSKMTTDWKAGKYDRGYMDGWNGCIENILMKEGEEYDKL